MEKDKKRTFISLSENVGRFNLAGKTLLIPEMNRIGCHLIAGVFRGFGVNALVMDTYKGLDIGLEYSSGKECFPCQVTLGDILYFMKREEQEKGKEFRPEDYIYFMPEADGPCRFGMYNKYQRIVLDSFPGLNRLKIGTLTTKDGYSLSGLIDKRRSGDLRKAMHFSVVVSDIMDRLLWRIRPYERKAGSADLFMEKVMGEMSDVFEKYGPGKEFDVILKRLEDVVQEGKNIIDHTIPAKPMIGIVGEIYLRSQVHSNQDLIRGLERYGAEVVNASISEWVNYITYSKLRFARSDFRLNLKQFRLNKMWDALKRIARFSGELYYQESRQAMVYKRVRPIMELAEDHKISHLEDLLLEEDIFSFDVGTEACLSIAGIIEYARNGFDGVVNVYPFACMPSTATSAVINPLADSLGIPYLDTPYDSSVQPGREAAIRTFMYQAQQHMLRHGGKRREGEKNEGSD
ncbi:MAG: CoA activase [Deltaproteobacteria bacterium]|nr:CoA activase [Deltaproteobacteria bacterium]